MDKYKQMKKYINILKWSLVGVYLVLIGVFVSSKNKKEVCVDVKVIVTDSISKRFVTADEIEKTIFETYPNLYGSLIKNLDFLEMEALVEKHPAIQSCHIYSNSKGILNIEVEQYKPILRVFSGSASFYFDETGHKIPISNNFNVNALVVNGTIPTNPVDLIKVSKYIKNDAFWDAQIEQIYIRRDNDYILAPRVGDHLIILGQPVDFEQKFKNLKAFYKQLDPKAWNDYKMINLKFKNQIVCSKGNL